MGFVWVLLVCACGSPSPPRAFRLECVGPGRFTGTVTDARLPSTVGETYRVRTHCVPMSGMRWGVAGSGAGSAMDGHELLRDLFALYRREGLTGVWSIGYGVTCSGRAGARVRVADYTQIERIIATTGEFLERTGTRFEAGFTMIDEECSAY